MVIFKVENNKELPKKLNVTTPPKCISYYRPINRKEQVSEPRLRKSSPNSVVKRKDRNYKAKKWTHSNNKEVVNIP